MAQLGFSRDCRAEMIRRVGCGYVVAWLSLGCVDVIGIVGKRLVV